jgi:hypothetical protein
MALQVIVDIELQSSGTQAESVPVSAGVNELNIRSRCLHRYVLGFRSRLTQHVEIGSVLIVETTVQIHNVIQLLRHRLIEAVQHSALFPNKQVVGCCRMVVFVELQTPDSIISGETERIKITEHVLFQTVFSWPYITWLHRGFLYLPVPRMCPDHRYREALIWLCCKQTINEILHSLSNELWRLVICCQDLSVQLSSVLIFEWQITADESEEDHATAPKVA